MVLRRLCFVFYPPTDLYRTRPRRGARLARDAEALPKVKTSHRCLESQPQDMARQTPSLLLPLAKK